jgi:4-hydroxy-3-methylbut-2-en-1-yl diphosphate reductase
MMTARTILRQVMRTTEVAAGEVLITTKVRHPDRGIVECPAAPLVAASTVSAGRPVRFGAATAGQEGNSILFLTSYLGRHGVAVGIGAAALAEDVATVAAARSAITTWSEALRTRRVLRAATEPMCPGAARAAGIIERAGRAGPVYAYGDVPGRAPTGAMLVRSLHEVPAGASVAFPAHGVSSSVRSQAAARDLPVIDGTCPLVEAAQAGIRAFAADGDTVLVLGRRGHAVVEGLSGQVPDHVSFAESEDDLPPAGAPGRVSFVLQPGVPVEELLPLATELRDRSQARGLHPDKWCYAASDRAAAIRAVAAESNIMLILGESDSADAIELARISGGADVHVIDNVTKLQPEWISRASTIGLAESTTAPVGEVTAILAALSGLGPLSVAHRHVSTSVDTDARPITVSGDVNKRQPLMTCT